MSLKQDLTVRENLLFSARLRLCPADYSAEDAELLVDRVVQALNLGAVTDGLVGDERRRGISGGQRKRVNVGVELVADPVRVFFKHHPSSSFFCER